MKILFLVAVLFAADLRGAAVPVPLPPPPVIVDTWDLYPDQRPSCWRRIIQLLRSRFQP